MKAIKIVIGLIVLLGVILSSSTFGLRCDSNYASFIKVRTDLKYINEALTQFEELTGTLPITLQELEDSKLARLWRDPWGNDYQYDPTKGIERRVFSLGADGEVGGEGLATDFYLDTNYKKI